ncbi:uncharacterized protein LOC116095003 isoform X2 [Mastomys coucha]|uniref:uncharacterized protein LOC116095003 isoform X2 n=1 Tax=Mastomys coucha TaxID=35658 RepID=UPI0012627F4E|nr:uncharacterized protein LOC116095003 isoform X2 [Mastomys coucha]
MQTCISNYQKIKPTGEEMSNCLRTSIFSNVCISSTLLSRLQISLMLPSPESRVSRLGSLSTCGWTEKQAPAGVWLQAANLPFVIKEKKGFFHETECVSPVVHITQLPTPLSYMESLPASLMPTETRTRFQMLCKRSYRQFEATMRVPETELTFSVRATVTCPLHFSHPPDSCHPLGAHTWELRQMLSVDCLSLKKPPDHAYRLSKQPVRLQPASQPAA